MALLTDPIDLMINTTTGDIVIPPVLTTGISAVVQSCRIALAMIRGEWFLDLDFGVPWFERVGVPAAGAIFGQKFNQPKANAAIRAALTDTAGVVTINRCDVSFNGSTRAIAVTWSVATVFGNTPVDTLALGT